MPRKFQFTVDKWAKKPVTKEEEGATPLKVSYIKYELRAQSEVRIRLYNKHV